MQQFRCVIIESPYKGLTGSDEEVANNLEYLRACMADAFRRGEAPYASHGLYTQPGVLNDQIPEERKRGMEAGFAWGERADARMVYMDLGIYEGMLEGILRAHALGQPVLCKWLCTPWLDIEI